MRAPHATDRRQVVLTATERGRELVRQSRRLGRRGWRVRPQGADAAGAGGAASGGPDSGEAQPVLTARPRSGSKTFGSLQTRNYRLFATGQVVSNTGSWMQRVAQDWLVLPN